MIVIGGRADATARYDLGAGASLEEGFFDDLTLCWWELVQLRSKYGVQVVEVVHRAVRHRSGRVVRALVVAGKDLIERTIRGVVVRTKQSASVEQMRPIAEIARCNLRTVSEFKALQMPRQTSTGPAFIASARRWATPPRFTRTR
jgi:hypothetical protein